MLRFLLSHCICKSVYQMKNINQNYFVLFLRVILVTQQLFPKFLLDSVTGLISVTSRKNSGTSVSAGGLDGSLAQRM